MLETVRAKLGVSAVLYHAALSTAARRAAHTAFIRDQARRRAAPRCASLRACVRACVRSPRAAAAPRQPAVARTRVDAIGRSA